MPTADPLEDVAFLARSAHRVGVLKTLADGPMTRPELHEQTGISQPTLGRILTPFEERNWVEKEGRAYALTAWGELLAADFANLVDTVESIQRLGDVIQQFPTDEMDFDLREFADATVTLPTAGDTFRHVLRFEELFYGADHVRILLNTVGPGTRDQRQERAADFRTSERYIESISTAAALDQAMADPETREIVREVVESDRVDAYRYEGSIPYMLAVADGTAILSPIDEYGVPTATIETENETIRSWVHAQLDAYREQATPLTLADVPE